MQGTIKAMWGVNVGHDFCRLNVDTPVEIDVAASSNKDGSFKSQMYGWIKGNPDSVHGFMRPARVRIAFDRRSLA